MTEKVELKIYGGKFQFVLAEMRYAAYQATLARTLESFNDRWLEHAMRRLLSESCKDVWNEEFRKFQDSVRRAAAAFVKSARLDASAMQGLDAIFTRSRDGLLELANRQLNEAYADIPQNASIDEVAETGKLAFTALLAEIQILAEQMSGIMREYLEENGAIACPKQKRGKVDGRAIFEELKNGIPDSGEKEAKKLGALNAMPMNRELIEWCWYDDDDKRPISELADAVGVSLQDIRKRAFDEAVGAKDFSSEDNTQAFRARVVSASAKYGYNATKLLKEIDQVLSDMDREARTAGGRLFDSREEARKQRVIVEFEKTLGIATEEEALQSRDRLTACIRQSGVDGKWTLQRIDQALSRFDLEARSVDGREFATREEAALQRQLSEHEAVADLSTEESALAAKTELTALIEKLGVNGDWKLERVNAALKRFDENARTAFGILYDTRDEAAKSRQSREAFLTAVKKAIADGKEENFFLDASIPPKKLLGARTYLNLEQDDGVFALLDTTFFGSAKTGLVVSNWGVVWKNDGTVDSPRTSFSWRDLGEIEPPHVRKDSTVIEFAKDAVYENCGSGVPVAVVAEILSKLHDYAAQAGNSVFKSDVRRDEVRSTAVVDGLASLKEALKKFGSESVFTDGDIPAKKKANAFASMRVQEPMDSIVVLIDATVWGSAKEGLVITDKAIYFKNLMEDPVRIAIEDVKSVSADGRDLVFNEKKFTPCAFEEADLKKVAETFAAFKRSK